ncbi:MAG TPA: CHASE domain-containing protein [Verrucomicrobiae bacterium]|nr:CHASE domain-containing protein [Verrucomicrobiae bacterium]
MYFISSRKRLTSNTLFLHLLPTGAVLLTLLSISLLGWHNARQALAAEKQNATSTHATSARDSVVERMGTYEVVLRGASALFNSSDIVTRTEWKNYVSSFDLQQKYPGIQSVGYISFVSPNQKEALTARMQQEGFPDFHLYPDGNRDTYTAVLYTEPFRSSAGLGYDMYAEPTRRAAMQRASATGEASLTSKLTFIQNDAKLSTNSGFTMFVPVYSTVADQSLPAGQRKIQGFAYAPFIGKNLFGGIFGTQSTTSALRIYDAADQSANGLLYESENYSSLAADTTGYSHTVDMNLYGRTWKLDFRFSPSIISENTRNRPTTALISGIILSALLSGFVLALLVARTRALGNTKQVEVQAAKDELLSLASHQLRTPATSVKQYIGMLKDGYAGNVNTDQQSLLDKAYESNERQLHIINQLLYVAKIDAQGIVITPRRINLNKLLRDLAAELTPEAEQKKSRIKLQLPSKNVFIEADEHCVRMSLENLLTNAIKYSYEQKPITVSLRTQKAKVRIAISDKGIGIATDDIPQLFQRFTRIPNELSNQTSGSGIGLYLSQQLIDLHDGSIQVTSTVGKGTTFTVTLPKQQVR